MTSLGLLEDCCVGNEERGWEGRQTEAMNLQETKAEGQIKEPCPRSQEGLVI